MLMYDKYTLVNHPSGYATCVPHTVCSTCTVIKNNNYVHNLIRHKLYIVLGISEYPY